MNKRIRELIQSQNSNRGLLWTEEDKEEFAELIVRECLEIVNRKEYSYHEADPLWETAEMIKEHFGVE